MISEPSSLEVEFSLFSEFNTTDFYKHLKSSGKVNFAKNILLLQTVNMYSNYAE